MSNSFFRFKQFTIWQDRCAMKVGTDGVLLGAWADVSGVKRVLDIGTGTGLVSLMIAQRCDAVIHAVEIDDDAAVQAVENVRSSPWQEKVTVSHIDFRELSKENRYDLIVSNPPYFVDSLVSPDQKRCLARHNDELTFSELTGKAVSLLNPGGRLTLIIPSDIEIPVINLAAEHQLFPIRKTYVQTKTGMAPKRLLLTFGLSMANCVTDILVVELSRHVYSESYINLTKDFYLKM